MATEKVYQDIGAVTAYAYAVSKGYTGTEEQFATELAQFAQNAQQVAEDRAAVEQLVDEFLNTTAPAVIQDVTDEGTSQVERVANAGTAQVTRVGEAGDTQIDDVAAAGTTQIGLVTAEGTTQVTRVQDKGDEVIDSIPADYTALTQEVSDLNQQLSDVESALEILEPDAISSDVGKTLIAKTVSGGKVTEYEFGESGNMAAFVTNTATGTIASFSDGADNVPVKSLVVNIESVQKGIGIPSPDNIRSITGFTGAKVTRAGKNLLGLNNIVSGGTSHGITYTVNSDGSISLTGEAETQVTIYIFNSSTQGTEQLIIPAGEYTISITGETSSNIHLVFSGANSNGVTYQDFYTGARQFTVTDGTKPFSYMALQIPSGATVDNTIKVQIELGFAATIYEPYQSNTYEVAFPAEAGNNNGIVCRGTLDASTGLLTVTHGMQTVQSFTGIEESHGFRTNTTLQGYAGEAYSDDIICNMFQVATSYGEALVTLHNSIGVNVNGVVLLNGYRDGAYMTLAQINELIPSEGCVIVYPVSQQTYQLDLMAVKTLLGWNNIWADCGNSTVEYRADPKGYIEELTDDGIAEKQEILTELNNAQHIQGSTAKALTILHFSDIHADKAALSRIMNDRKQFGSLVDDAICTGDIVAGTYASISSWWDKTVLTCIGNHDTASYSSETGYDWTALSMADRSAYYIEPFESNWNITHPSGLSYYYKDYADEKIRLIVMDVMLYADNGTEATAQTSWLASLLSDAITNNLHVLIAIHAIHGGATPEICSFTKYGQSIASVYPECNTPQTVIDTVTTAIDNGLHFIGYICGHTHQDNIWNAENDGKQLMFNITCASTVEVQWKGSDQNRYSSASPYLNKYYDAYNLITIDTTNTLVKIVRGGGADIDDHMRTRKAICFNYSTGQMVGEVL